MDIELPEKNKSPEVNIDWLAYFAKFCQLHGDPVAFKGKLLFPDGWTYSANDHAGPEFPPPSDRTTLLKLQLRYWKYRHAVVKHERHKLQEMIKGLRELQSVKSAPLQRTVSYVNSDGQPISEQLDLDTNSEEFKGRLEWLTADSIKSQEIIADLTESLNELTHNRSAL